MTSRRLFCAAAAAALAGCATRPGSPPAAAVSELGSTGKLRAAINYGNPIRAAGRRRAAAAQQKASGFVADALRRHRIAGAAVAPAS